MFKKLHIKSQFDVDKRKGLAWMLARCLAFSVMSVALGMISKEIGAFQTFFLTIVARFCILIIPVLYVNGLNLKTKFFKTYIVRALLTTLGFTCYIAALKEISLNEVTAISFTAPLFTTAFASIFLGESFTLKRMLALTVGFIGAMVIIRPDIRPLDIGTILAISTAILWSLGDIVVKVQANLNEKVGTQMFWSTIFMMLCAFPFAAIEYFYFDVNNIPSLYDWKWIFISGLFILLTNLAFFLSSRYSDLAYVMPFSFSKLIFTAIITYFAFGDTLKENTAFGSIIILASCVYLINAEREKKVKKA
jgi:drug/metabolite transporter (DMT)-like permease